MPPPVKWSERPCAFWSKAIHAAMNQMHRPTTDRTVEVPSFGYDVLANGGEMGELMRAHNWAATPVGAPENWPHVLRTAVRLVLTTRQPMFIWWGPDLIQFYNDAYRKTMIPERPLSALGRPGRECWAEIWPIIGPQIEQVMSGGEATWHEDQLVPVTRHGRREDLWWTYGFSPIDDPSAPNGVGGVLGICNDVTQEHRAREALRKVEVRTRLALSSADIVGTWDWDVTADRVYADARFARLYGVDPLRAEAGAPLAEFTRNIHEDDRERVEQAIATALDSGDDFSAEYRLVLADRSKRWVAARGRVTKLAEQSALHFAGVTIDVTERRQIEAQLRELNADLERRVVEPAQARSLTWQLSPDLLGALNSKGYFETSNPAWKAVLGWSEAEVARMSIFELLHPEDLEHTRAGFELTQVGQAALRFANRYRCKDGSYRWISWVGIPEEGYVYCTGRDITAERAAEIELADAQEALRHSQKMETIGHLTGGIAHDFNNLLTGIIGALDMVSRRMAAGRSDDMQRFLDAASASAHRAGTLTHRLLAFGRRQPLDARPNDVNRLVASMEDLLCRTLGENIRLQSKLATDLWTAFVDANQLESALLNLAINARDAMPHGGQLKIETANAALETAYTSLHEDLKPGDYVLVSVSDTGTGMPPDVLARAIDPFFTTKPVGEGTGLGLSMIYGFARQSNGHLRIDSDVGQGTMVGLYIPRAFHDAVDQEVPVVDIPRGKGETILVVEDDTTVRMIISAVLEELGYDVILASDARPAIPLLKSDRRIDLMVSDVVLPHINGRKLAEIARASRPDLKVLFVTGYAEHATSRADFLDVGMDMLTKPFALDAFGAKVRAMIEQ
jgi:PAS domain S-box-containing protein